MITPSTVQYSDLSSEYLRRAKAYLAVGDLTQASERSWGAAAVAVKAVATAHGLSHCSHRQIRMVVQDLARKADDDEVRACFGHANDVHMNVYEGWLDQETIALCRSQVERLIAKRDELS